MKTFSLSCTKTDLLGVISMFLSIFLGMAFAQGEGEFKLVLPQHKGQLSWKASGFKAIEFSAKPNGNEIGIRGENTATHVRLLGFLFVVTDLGALTSTKCRDGALHPRKESNPNMSIVESWEETSQTGAPIALVKYTARGAKGRPVYMERGFVASGDICGDLEFYSEEPLQPDSGPMQAFSSYSLDESHVPQFRDIFAYGEILYNHHEYGSAGPLFELALEKLHEQPAGDVKTMTRVLRDQAGMSYGISGNTSKSRALFEKGIAEDPDYPLYYYNLACADASERNLKAARDHLQMAFARKANILHGETMPDPTTDDSFLPYKGDKEFWAFLQTLSQKH